jgi:antitoxin component YwqK of YwqJK toxin-antitoxin module
MTFFQNGKPEQRGFYHDGLPEGYFINWFEDGTLKEEGRYRQGKKDGQFLFYQAGGKGKLEVLANYCDDQPCGEWVWYNRKGKPRSSGKPSITD